MTKFITALVFVLLLLPRPAQAHTESEIEAWEVDWNRRMDITTTVNWREFGDPVEAMISDLMAERVDFESRHPCHYEGECERVHAPAGDPTPKSKSQSGWRSLVEKYFEPDEVERALCLIQKESRGDPGAVNPSSGAAGLFQVMPFWEAKFGLNRLDAESNVKMAKWILDEQGWVAWSPYKRGECRG